jgi:hypothetical protein
VHHGLARRKNALAVRIAGRGGQVADHVLLDFFGRVKTEHRQVADIELDELLALFFHLLGGVHDRAADVVKHIGKLGGFGDRFHETSGGFWERTPPCSPCWQRGEAAALRREIRAESII